MNGGREMRKVIVSFVAGILVAIGTSAAYAEVTSMIGKRVDGQFPLKIGGELSEIPAITIEGVSYIPLRAAGELFGAQVSWMDGEIIMQPNQESVIREDLQELARQQQEEFDRKSERINEYARARNKLTTEIENLKVKMKFLKMEMGSIESKIEENPEYISVEGPVRYKDTPQYQRDLDRIAQLKSEIETIQSEISDLEAQLADLEQQKAELEAQQ